ncbi:MAG: hypothetical protein JOY64_13010 [Alphaproteobacteria bacterium]|nr:hypothetical protein [Alphaproteobacteria bacterium]
MWVFAALGGLALAGCNPLPTPDYVNVTTPPSYRVESGVRVDNDGYKLDNQGYRVDNDGERLGIVDIPEKTVGDQSNAVAGYYISNTGQNAPGKVASTSDVTAPAPVLPTPAQMPPQAPITPAPANIPPPPGYK